MEKVVLKMQVSIIDTVLTITLFGEVHDRNLPEIWNTLQIGRKSHVEDNHTEEGERAPFFLISISSAY